MKTTILLLLMVILICSCQREKPITICMTFHPAFHRSMEITLTTNKQDPAIGCVVFSWDSATCEAAFDAADIPLPLLTGFWQQLDTLPLLQIPSSDNRGFDGMSISGDITTEDSNACVQQLEPPPTGRT